MKKIIKLMFLAVITFLFSCKEDTRETLYSGGAPAPVRNAVYQSIPGGAKISYDLPKDEGLLYIRADYELNGVKMQTKSSYYDNSIVVEGFGDTKEREITLYAVSRSEKLSTPTKIMISPLPAPVYDVFNSLIVDAGFGGFSVDFENPAALGGGINSNVTIGILKWDTVSKEWVQFDTHYSGLSVGHFAVRGQDPIETKFGMFLRDRWGNYTDTLERILTPWPEVELDKTKFKDARKNPVPQIAPFPELTGIVKDAEHNGSYTWDKMFNDDYTDFFHTKERFDMPIWMPIDLGVKAKLSRYVVWQRTGGSGSGWPFTHGNPHEWEIWGTNTISDVNSWVKLDHQVMIKPSGSPIGVNTNDDKAIAEAGMEYNFSPGSPAVRYVAWKHIDNWASVGGATGFLHISELKFFGEVIK